jgi:hypothetical protein
MTELAQHGAVANHGAPPSRVAIVAPTSLLFGLARMYQTCRELAGGTRDVRVFRSRAAAAAWLDTPRPTPPS